MEPESRPTAAPAVADDAARARILEAVQYLNQCRVTNRGFAILTGAASENRRLALDEFLQALPEDCQVVRLPAPTDSPHLFLEAALVQFGFEPFESSADDLMRLVTVVLRQGGTNGGSPILILEDAQSYGPRVLETVRELARAVRDTRPSPLIVLTGHAGLNRVLDSPGMASVREFTRHRFDCTTPPQVPEDGGVVTTDSGDMVDTACPAPATLTVSLNHDVVREVSFARDRLLIGRGPHSDIRIGSRFVSRQHALLIRNTDGDWLIDLKSTNGTAVNARLVRQHLLRDGDVISIGNYRLLYSNPAAVGASPDPGADLLSETVVMRSLRALRDLPDRSAAPDESSQSSAA